MPEDGKAKDARPETEPVRLTGLSWLAGKLKEFKEIVTAALVLGGLGYAGFVYFAPASELKKLECALHSHGLLSVQRGSAIKNYRNRISAQDQERLLNDLLVIISTDDNDSDDMKRLKERLRAHIAPRIEKIRDQTAKLQEEEAKLNEGLEKLVRLVERKTCPA